MLAYFISLNLHNLILAPFYFWLCAILAQVHPRLFTSIMILFYIGQQPCQHQDIFLLHSAIFLSVQSHISPSLSPLKKIIRADCANLLLVYTIIPKNRLFWYTHTSLQIELPSAYKNTLVLSHLSIIYQPLLVDDTQVSIVNVCVIYIPTKGFSTIFFFSGLLYNTAYFILHDVLYIPLPALKASSQSIIHNYTLHKRLWDFSWFSVWYFVMLFYTALTLT